MPRLAKSFLSNRDFGYYSSIGMKPENNGHSEFVPLVRKHSLVINRALLAGIVIFITAVSPVFAQAGGEVVDVKVTHYESTLGRKAPPDLITLMLRVVDEHGHEFQGTSRLTESGAKAWLRDGLERQVLLIRLYIELFPTVELDTQRLSTNAKIDPEKAQGYVPLGDIVAVAGKCESGRLFYDDCIRKVLKSRSVLKKR